MEVAIIAGGGGGGGDCGLGGDGARSAGGGGFSGTATDGGEPNENPKSTALPARFLYRREAS